MTDSLSFLDKYRDLKILIAPLNWGLGHATRSLAVINVLEKNNELIIASEGLSLEWLKNEKPHHQFVNLPAYNIRYSPGAMWYNMLLQAPHICKTVIAENKATQKLVQELHVDLVISDHRLGVRANGIKNVLIAHQLRIPHPNSIISWFATRIQKNFIDQFTEVWIPDCEGEQKLSGILSESDTDPIKRYIGPLSRFERGKTSLQPFLYDIAVLLSGPEPARTILEETLLSLLSELGDKNIVLVRGTHANMKRGYLSEKIKLIDLAGTEQLNEIFDRSKLIICRSGYSSIMDLCELGKNAILIPTPNQPEQQYLAELNSLKNQFYNLEQSDLNVQSLQKSLDYFELSSK